MILSAYLRSYSKYDGASDYKEHIATPARLYGNDYFLWTEPAAEDAFKAAWEGAEYICPRHPRLRMLEGMLAFNNAFPEAGIIPQNELIAANDELSRLRGSSRSMRSHILTSAWHVPIRWFAAFTHEEKEIYETERGLSVRYRTSMSSAQERVGRAVQIVEGAGFDPGVVGQVESLDSWLRRFAADSMLELDYDRVAELFSDGDLVLDESVADTASSLHALEQGNYEEAGAFYAAIARRWGRVQALAFAN